MTNVYGDEVNVTINLLLKISGYKYNDTSLDGPTTADPGISGWNIYLSKDGTQIASTTTDVTGFYQFNNLLPGDYVVTEEARSGWTNTTGTPTSYNVTLTNLDVTGRNSLITEPLHIRHQV